MRADLDHVALATRDAMPALRTLVADLGGTILFGGQSAGFRAMQVQVGDADAGMRIELLEPWRTDEHDFLDRFLARHGQGPHHLTFKVPSLDEALAECDDAGLTPVNVDRSDPEWQEAFLLPRQAQGTVVQLAEVVPSFASRAEHFEHVLRHGPHAHPRWWQDVEQGPRGRACLERVVLRTRSLDDARELFADLLGGAVEHESTASTDLVWPSGGRLRLVQEDAPPGVVRLEGQLDGPSVELNLAGTSLRLADRRAG